MLMLCCKLFNTKAFKKNLVRLYLQIAENGSSLQTQVQGPICVHYTMVRIESPALSCFSISDLLTPTSVGNFLMRRWSLDYFRYDFHEQLECPEQ